MNPKGMTAANLSSIMPAYSNVSNNIGPDVLDEFIRRNDIDPILVPGKADMYDGSQATREQPIYLLKNDLARLNAHQMRWRPPMVPRSLQVSNSYQLQHEDGRPFVAARPGSQRLSNYEIRGTEQILPLANRFSMSSYQNSFHDQIRPQTLSYLDSINGHLNRLVKSTPVGHYPSEGQHNTAYANSSSSFAYINNDHSRTENLSEEHIYDLNTYATPEQTPLNRPTSVGIDLRSESERPRVSHLIQTFNSKAPG